MPGPPASVPSVAPPLRPRATPRHGAGPPRRGDRPHRPPPHTPARRLASRVVTPRRLACSLPLAALLAAPVAADGSAATPAVLTSLERGVLHERIATTPDPTQSFTLFLPTAFDPARRWPLLLVFDPRARGRLGAELFAPAAERWGWIVASSENTRSDGDFEVNRRAVNAMFPDLVARLPVDERRIYATGFSGGAIVAWILGQSTGRLAGVIAVGGRPVEGHDRLPPSFDVWIEAGRTDFNYQPSLQLAALAAKGDRAHRFEVFEGRHEWFPPEDAARAVAWLELAAARDGTAPMPPPETIAAPAPPRSPDRGSTPPPRTTPHGAPASSPRPGAEPARRSRRSGWSSRFRCWRGYDDCSGSTTCSSARREPGRAPTPPVARWPRPACSSASTRPRS